MHDLWHKLKYLKQNLKGCNKKMFHNIFIAKTSLDQEMEYFQQQMIMEGRTDEKCRREIEIQTQIDECCKHEEMIWKENLGLTG